MTETSVLAIITTVLAGLAHLVERHLAKVEVASSSLVARSKKETPPIKRGEIRKQAKTLISSRFKDSGQTGYK